jgi:exosortase A
MSAVPPAPTFNWKQSFAAIVFVELALIALYFDTAQAMVGIWWRSETFNHAFLVPPIALWLIWEKRHALVREAPKPTLWLILPLLAVAFGWLLGELAAVNAVTQFALVAMLVLVVPLVIGLPAARRIAFPLFFLFFAVPVGEFVMPKLMEWTAMFTVMGLRASGIPVYQEGLHFVIPSGKWSVVEACSGVRYLIASIVVGTLYAYINYQSLKRRLIFVGVSILVPLVANWVRAYLIVMIGHYSGNQLAVGADHLIYGWVFFGVVIMIMFAIGMRWREYEAELPAVGNSSNAMSASRAGNLLVAVVLALGVACAPRAAIRVLESGPELPQPTLSVELLAQDGWGLAEGSFADWQPAFANPSGTLNAVLAKDGRRVGVFIAYYRQQNYERKLISSQNELVKSNNKTWAQVGRGSHDVLLAGQQVSLRTGTLRNNLSGIGAEPDRYRVWHWYWIDGRIVTSDHLGKLRLALSRLSGHGDESAAVFLYTQEPDGDAVLADFLASAGGGITKLIEQAAVPRR